jgi:hypothetical protein
MGILFYGCENSSFVRQQTTGKIPTCHKMLATLLSGKAFAVFERLAAEAKEDYKTLTN